VICYTLIGDTMSKQIWDKKAFEQALYQDIDPSWAGFFFQERSKPYYQDLIDKVYEAYNQYPCYPEVSVIFRVFKEISLSHLKVLIMGQDPYHTKDVADGLAFSSKIKLAPSLRNIYKELHRDLGVENVSSDLTSWSKQGVMLLNSALSVEEGKANAHQKYGWNEFVIGLLGYLSCKEDLVYILWGNHAKSYQSYINNGFIIEGYHPSPFSAKHFYGGSYFSRCNEYLLKQGIQPIDWRI